MFKTFTNNLPSKSLTPIDTYIYNDFDSEQGDITITKKQIICDDEERVIKITTLNADGEEVEQGNIELEFTDSKEAEENVVNHKIETQERLPGFIPDKIDTVKIEIARINLDDVQKLLSVIKKEYKIIDT